MTLKNTFVSDNICKPSSEIIDNFTKYDHLQDDYIHNYIEDFIQKLLCCKFQVNYVTSVTAGNILALDSYNVKNIICSNNSHIYKYEKKHFDKQYSINYKVIGNNKGKINIEDFENLAEKHNLSEFTLIISIPSENGLFYKDDEVNRILKVLVDNNIHLHIDGARFFYYLNQTSKAYKKLFKYARSIVIGFSKFGLLFGEILCIKDENIIVDTLIYLQNISKADYIKRQIYIFIKHNLHIKYPLKAINIAKYFKDRVDKLSPNIKFYFPIESNILYLKLNSQTVKTLSKHYKISISSSFESSVRIATSYSNTKDDVDQFCKYLLKGFCS